MQQFYLKYFKKQRGVAALIFVLAVTSLVVVTAVVISRINISNTQADFKLNQKLTSQTAMASCISDALWRINDKPQTEGTFNMNAAGINCVYKISSTSSGLKTVTTTASTTAGGIGNLQKTSIYTINVSSTPIAFTSYKDGTYYDALSSAAVVCGDWVCNGSETCSTCAADCGSCYCGNGTCAGIETAANCAADCPASCGDANCTHTETCNSCAGDCGACASSCGTGHTDNGNGTCTATLTSSSADGTVYYSFDWCDYTANGSLAAVGTANITIGMPNDGYSCTVYRGYVYFDTSTIPSTATISAATLRLKGNTKYMAGGAGSIRVMNGQTTYPHNPLVKGDYNEANYSGDGGSFAVNTFVGSGSFNDITLNATGRSWIYKGAAATTKFALRNTEDISHAGAPADGYLVFYEAQNQLVVTYTP